MQKIYSTDTMPEDYIDDPKFVGLMKSLYLGHTAGSEKLYVNIDILKPGAKSVKYHSHSAQEEFFLVLKGSGLLRIDEKEIPVKEGSFFSKPGGRGIAHQFINNGEELLQILDCGTKQLSDTVYYPDENVFLVKPERKIFRSDDEIKSWSSDPNIKNR